MQKIPKPQRQPVQNVLSKQEEARCSGRGLRPGTSEAKQSLPPRTLRRPGSSRRVSLGLCQRHRLPGLRSRRIAHEPGARQLSVNTASVEAGSPRLPPHWLRAAPAATCTVSGGEQTCTAGPARPAAPKVAEGWPSARAGGGGRAQRSRADRGAGGVRSGVHGAGLGQRENFQSGENPSDEAGISTTLRMRPAAERRPAHCPRAWCAPRYPVSVRESLFDDAAAEAGPSPS